MREQSIRRLTPDEQEERRDDRYNELYAQIEASMHEEYDRMFSGIYGAQHHYKPDGRRIHAAAMAQMQREAHGT